MKFALLGVVAFAQFGRQGHTRQQYGREDGQQMQRQQPHRDNMFGRFGGKTDVNRRDNRYGYNKHVGRYGGYTRRYNPTTHRFGGREDPFRQDANGDGHRGYHLYGHGQERRHGKNGQKQKNPDRLGEICSQITSQNYERECGTYTGRMGCRYTCEKLREGRHGYTHFGRKTKKTNPFARFEHRGQTQQHQYPQMQQHRFGGRTQTNPMQRFGQHNYGQRTQTHHGLHIPTQGGIFGRHKTGRKTTKTNPFARFEHHGRTQTRQHRGIGQNGIFGNRLGQEGHNHHRIQV